MVTMKKKIVSIFLSLALLFTICPTFASSANETDSDLASANDFRYVMPEKPISYAP